MQTTDITALKQHTELRALITQDLGDPKSRGGAAWLYKCPLHNEQHGTSLAVWPDSWHCFGACQKGGDIIAWVMARQNVDFKSAINALGGDSARFISPNPRTEPLPRHDPPGEPPDLEWQHKAEQIIAQAVDNLSGPGGERAMRYLLETRGLNLWTIRTAELGYIPGGPGQWIVIDGLSVPCGITIPWRSAGNVWAIKVRRAAGDIRYQQVGGGNVSSSLYMADDIDPTYPVLITEGEFNALSGYQANTGLAVVSVGTSGQKLNAYWLPALASCPIIYALYDCDPAGDKGYQRLAKLSGRIKRVYMPQGVKDLNDLSMVGGGIGHSAVRKWLQSLGDIGGNT